MDTEIRARKATADDVDTIVSFNTDMARELEGKRLDVARLRRGVEAVVSAPEEGRGFYVVAESGGEVIAVLHVTYEWSPWRNGTFWWLNNVFVAPRWRRRGVYRAMHRFVESLARAEREFPSRPR